MKKYLINILLVQAAAIYVTGAFANSSVVSTVATGGRDTADLTSSISPKNAIKTGLVHFNAAYESNKVGLHWNLIPVGSYDHFDIERSVDGLNFEKQGEVKINGVSKDYYFNDNIRPSVARKNDLYYRLRQIDGDNKSVYSKYLIVRTFNTKSVAAISVTPDPAVNDIEVNVQLKENSFISAKVMTLDGQEILKKTLRGADGENIFSMTGTSHLKPGTYTLEIIVNSNERMTMKLEKI